MKIKNSGYQHIFYSREIGNCIFTLFTYPDEIIINGEKQDNIISKYNFNTTNNIIDIKME